MTAARAAGALLLLALLVNVVHLGSKSMVLDECASAAYARADRIELIHVLVRSDPNMSLYYVLLNFWVRVFGDSEAALRVPSALFGALTVPAFYLLGRRLFGATAGLVAGLLLALNPFMVRYAQTARSYSLLALLITLSSIFFVREIEQPSRSNRIGYVITSGLAFYAHYFAAYVLAAHMLTILAVKRRSALTRTWLGVAAAILLACAPEALIVYHSGGVREHLGWVPPASVSDVGLILFDFAGRRRLLLVLPLAGGCYALALAWRERRAWPVELVALWLLVPMALSFWASLVQPMFITRYLIICVPALILLGVAGIARLRPPIVAAAVAALLVWSSATGLAAYYAGETPENWRDATRHVLASTVDGDGAVFVPNWAYSPFAYYARQSGVAGPVNLDAQPALKTQRIWLVIREADVKIKLAQPLSVQASLRERGFQLVEQRAFAGVEVDLYVR